eukprot:6186267-Pleurochrysis_carterae.AAC.6
MWSYCHRKQLEKANQHRSTSSVLGPLPASWNRQHKQDRIYSQMRARVLAATVDSSQHTRLPSVDRRPDGKLLNSFQAPKQAASKVQQPVILKILMVSCNI